MKKRMLYIIIGFLVGFLMSNYCSLPELEAQLRGKKGGLQQNVMTPSLPTSYGWLVGVDGLKMYFQAEDGTVYIVETKSESQLSSSVTVITRS